MSAGNLFLIGLAKSGTTYLRNILNASPFIKMGMEKFRQVHAAQDAGRNVEPYAKWLEALPKRYPKAVYVGDKIIFQELENFKRWFELYGDSGARIILLVRDPRDRVVSARFHILNRERKASAEAFYPYWNPPREEMVWWNEWVPVLQEKGALTIRYEDLFFQPEESITRIVQFLNLTADAGSIRNWIQKSNSPHWLTYGTNTYRSGVPGEWKSRLFPEECLKIREALGDVLSRYEWETEPGWELSILGELKPFAAKLDLSGAFASSMSWEFWEWFKINRKNFPGLTDWFRAKMDYADPFMYREYYPLRWLPVPVFFQRKVIRWAESLRQKTFRSGARSPVKGSTSSAVLTH